jgi:hypothetical protein
MPQPVPEITSLNDPRLDIPYVTIYDQKSLGCSFFLFCLLPIAPMIYSIIAPANHLRVVQYIILALTALWVITIISNIQYARKVRKTAQPGQATLVDKFIDTTVDMTTYTLVYAFKHKEDNNEVKMYQTRIAVSTPEEFDVPIGSTLNFVSTPVKSQLNSLVNNLPFMWIISGANKFRKKINRWTFGTSFLLILFSLLVIWARAAYLATANIWMELSYQQAINPYLDMLRSLEPLNHIRVVLQTIPMLMLVIAVAVFFMFQPLFLADD